MNAKFPARTVFSMCVYWITLAVFALLTIFWLWFVVDMTDSIQNDGEGATYWIALYAILEQSFLPVLLMLSLLLRSGACLWLLGLWVMQFGSLYIHYLLSDMSIRFKISLVGSPLLAIAIAVVALIYLVRKQELRKP